jgi:N-acetylmuramic acid 6-phosphate (MurNAc-6-P) etherase
LPETEAKAYPRTEAVNPLTRDIDTWNASEIVAAINAEDHRVAPALTKELPAVAKAAELAAKALTTASASSTLARAPAAGWVS